MAIEANTTIVAALRGATCRYGKVTALDRLDLSIHAGEVLALLGPNGAGKSTAIALLLGLIRPDAGEAELFGRAPHALAARRRIGVMLQSAELPRTLRVGELVALTARYYPAPRALAETVALAGIEHLLARRCATLSGGEMRRLQFALAICGNPGLLFLDEPTVGLDIDARQKLWASVRALSGAGCAVLLTTHYLEEAEALADRVVLLAHGRAIESGSVDALRARVARASIRCLSRLDPALATAWPGVVAARRHGEQLEIVSTETEATLRHLLAADPDLTQLEVRRAGLADAFLELTRDDQLAEAA